MQVGFPAAAAAGAQVGRTIEVVTGQMDALSLESVQSDFQLRLNSQSAYPDAEATKSWTASWIADPRPAFNAISSSLASSLSVRAIALAVEYLQGTEEDNVFGKRKWEDIGCRVASPPSLPIEFEGLWQGECPGFPGKKVHEICYLYFMPKEVNGKSLTPQEMGRVARQAPIAMLNRAHYTEQTNKTGIVAEEGDLSYFGYGQLGIDNPYWALLPTVVTEESRGKATAEQEKLIPQGWERPGMLDVIVANFTWFIWNRLYMHGNEPITQVICKERLDQTGLSADKHHVFVGSFDHEGLHVYTQGIDDCTSQCTIGMRKFFGPIVQKAKL